MLIRVNVERVTLDTATSRFVVILKEDKRSRWLPIVVGSSEAQAIALQLENISPPRPLTHDLMRNLLETMDVKIERIVVNDLQENTYYALLGLRHGSEFRDVDARPSDAIALALRTKAPIFVEGKVMQQASITDEAVDDAAGENAGIAAEENLAPEDQLEQLKIDLHNAVQDERYEDAANIRDEISRLRRDLRQE
ncbi:MAG: bifunctional nuclease family protein [candidate division KSB1 bacterium]|nr:bifunctional nuclease family protein [candidate division KSB1 bacterium]